MSSTIRLLGPFEVEVERERVAIGSAQQRTLLLLLALAAPGPVAIDSMIDALWPDQPVRDPAATVMKLIYRLRRCLPAGTITKDGLAYRLSGCDVDLRELETTSRLAREALMSTGPSAAEPLYHLAAAQVRGPLAIELFDVTTLRAEIERINELVARTLEDHARVLVRLDRIEEALQQIHAAHDAQPTRPGPVELGMNLYMELGRTLEAKAIYERYLKALDELGVAPSRPLARAYARLSDGREEEARDSIESIRSRIEAAEKRGDWLAVSTLAGQALELGKTADVLDRETRFRLTLARLRSLRTRGADDEAQSHRVETLEAGRAVGPAAFALSVITTSSPDLGGVPSEVSKALVEEGLAVNAGPSIGRAGLLAMRCLTGSFLTLPAMKRNDAETALKLIDQLAPVDPIERSLVAYADLIGSLTLYWGTPKCSKLLSAWERYRDLHGNVAALVLPTLRIGPLLQLGHRGAVEAMTEELRTRSNAPGGQSVKALVALLDGMVSNLDGRWADAEAAESKQGELAGLPHADSLRGVGNYSRIERGATHSDMAPDLQILAMIEPEHPYTISYRALAGALLLADGRPDEAKRQIDPLVRNEAVPFAENGERMTAYRWLADIAEQQCDRKIAELLLPLVRCHTGQFLTGGDPSLIWGAADRTIGQLLRVLDCFDEAEHHFRLAVETEEGVRSGPLAARTRYHWARMYQHRGASHDRDRQRALAEKAASAAQRLQMRTLFVAAEKLTD